ncbi:hypothetical protein KSP39_PZI019048 [Platanthera zijinensis]|uniref:Uncharacterized protein n=1 Tax=Platanthera zijinensis TaxID=2320716 RepID=A0AAP0FXT1_9ASPA
MLEKFRTTKTSSLEASIFFMSKKIGYTPSPCSWALTACIDDSKIRETGLIPSMTTSESPCHSEILLIEQLIQAWCQCIQVMPKIKSKPKILKIITGVSNNFPPISVSKFHFTVETISEPSGSRTLLVMPLYRCTPSIPSNNSSNTNECEAPVSKRV